MTLNERQLLAAAKQGQAAAVEELLQRYEPQIYRFGLRMCGDEEDAKEVLQETLLAAFRGLHEFRQEASLSTWLYQIARSFCIKERRGPRPEQVPLEQEALRSVPTPAESPDATAHARQLGQLIHAAILSLSEKDREAIVLRDVEGLSAEEAAQVVGIEVRALKSRLHRARMKLREQLSAVLNAPHPETAPCPELAEELVAYSAQEIDQATCSRLEAHLSQCTRCSAACEDLKKTVSLCRQIPGGEVPAPIRAAVRRALAASVAKE